MFKQKKSKTIKILFEIFQLMAYSLKASKAIEG
jgi:hypothetical protein